jgi:hypothetical protein
VEKKQEEKEATEELIENKVSFLYALQGLEVTRKCVQQLDMENDVLVCAVSSKTSSTH